MDIAIILKPPSTSLSVILLSDLLPEHTYLTLYWQGHFAVILDNIFLILCTVQYQSIATSNSSMYMLINLLSFTEDGLSRRE